MEAATAFTTVALSNNMRPPFAFLPMGLLQHVRTKVALKRISGYLPLPELTEYVVCGGGEGGEGGVAAQLRR